MYGRPLHGNRAIPWSVIRSSEREACGGKARSRSRRCTTGRSLLWHRAMKPTNKAGRPAAESVERRPETKGNAEQQSTLRTQSRDCR
jgi:hypothetical protein